MMEPAARWGASARARGSRSASRAARQQARGPCPWSCAPRSIRAGRGSSGRAAMRRPRAVARPLGSSAPRRCRVWRAAVKAAAGGGSSQGRAVGSAPQTASCRVRPQRSASRISGRVVGRRPWSSAWRHRRQHRPGSVRPARPARCTAPARETRSVTRRVRPLAGSNRASRARPQSTTMRTPSIVNEVSAMAVASTTLRRPGGDGARAASCAWGERFP